MASAISRFEAWVRQPTTIAGIAGLVSAAAGGAAQLAQHQLALTGFVSIVVAAVVAIILPDNSAARTAAGTLAAEVLSEAQAKRLDAEKLLAEAMALEQSLVPPPATFVAEPAANARAAGITPPVPAMPVGSAPSIGLTPA